MHAPVRLRRLAAPLVAFPLAALLLVTASAQTPPTDPAAARTVALDARLPMDSQVRVGTLANGLRYYIRANGRPEKRAELRLVVNAGSVLEDDDQRGLAHFVEHMAFNGTTHFAAQKLVEFMESIGMRFGPELNASTGFDETIYQMRVPTDTPGPLRTAVQILEDWAHGLSFDPKEIDKERGVVIEEWRLGQGAGARMRDKQFPILFQGSRYATRLPIGDRATLETFPHAALTRFYREWYRPDLMAVIAVGDFDPAEVETLVKRHFAAIPDPSHERPRRVYDVPDVPGTRFAIATDKEATGTSVAVYHTLPVRDEGTAGAYRQMLVEALYNGMLNQRFSELAQKPDPPFIGASSGTGRLVRSAEVYALTAMVKEDGVPRGLQALLVESARVARYGFTASELDRAKRDLMRGIESAYAERTRTSSSSYVREYVDNFLEGEPSPGVAYEYELFKRFVPGITLDEIDRLARTWLGGDDTVVLVNAPDKPGLHVPDEAELRTVMSGVDRMTIAPYVDTVSDQPLVAAPPAPGTITATRAFPKVGVTQWTLSNGATVVVKPTDFKEDQVLFRAFAPGGTSLASDDDFVAASTAAFAVSSGGLGSFSAIQLRKRLAGTVASAQPTFSELEQGLSGSASPKDLETLFQLIYLDFTAPRADREVFDTLKTQIKASLENRQASPGFAFQKALQAAMTRDHPRARPFTPETVDHMDLDRSMAFYQARFADASGFTFVFVGKVDPATLRPLVERYLAALPSAGRKETWKDLGIEPPDGVVTKVVHKGLEPKSQTAMVFTGPFQYDRAHRNALRAMATVLETRLRDKLREDLGATYSVGVSPSVDWAPRKEYQLAIQFGSAPDRAAELAKAVLAEIARLKAGPVEASEVTAAREAMLREYQTGMTQNGFWLAQLAVRYQQGQPLDDLLTYPASLDALTPAVIQGAAKTYLDTGRYVQVTLLPEEKK
jgi:zinc protease